VLLIGSGRKKFQLLLWLDLLETASLSKLSIFLGPKESLLLSKAIMKIK